MLVLQPIHEIVSYHHSELISLIPSKNIRWLTLVRICSHLNRWTGEVGGRKGLFPASYVKILWAIGLLRFRFQSWSLTFRGEVAGPFFIIGITSWGQRGHYNVSISFKSLPNSAEASTLVKLLYIDDSKAAAEKYLGIVDAHYVELYKDNMARIEQKQGNPDSRCYRPRSNVDKTLFYLPCSSIC